MRRARLLAFFLDVALLAATLDLAALLATLFIAILAPGEPRATRYPWFVAGTLLLLGLLARDARGGLSRRWLALQVQREDGTQARIGDSVARNFPLLVPGWNLFEALKVARDGNARRFGDQLRGTRVVRTA